MIIRPETPSLYTHIRALLCAAFPTATEADLVDRLREEGDVAFALAALEGDTVAGHVMLSPMTAPMRALGLGPVAVAPARQRQGVGRRLIDAALECARADGWQAVFVLGEPAYYGRFGFSVAAAAGFATPYAGPYFMALGLNDGAIAPQTGRVDYARAFHDLA